MFQTLSNLVLCHNQQGPAFPKWGLLTVTVSGENAGFGVVVDMCWDICAAFPVPVSEFLLFSLYCEGQIYMALTPTHGHLTPF